MTTPSYTTPTEHASAAASETVAGPLPVTLGKIRLGLDLNRRPRPLETALDLAALAFIGLAFWTDVLTAEFLFHCVFVVLVLHAFLFGLRGTLVRIAIASIPLLVYANAAAFGFIEPPLELTEWPLMFVIAALVAWMADMRRATAGRYAGLFRLASERLLTVQEDERRRIAGELHDNVGQVLTALTLTLDAARGTEDRSAVRGHITAARALADTALAETRDLSHRIRPARLEERGLIAALADLTSESAFRVAIHVAPEARDPALLTSTATVEVFRVVQEALANASRHSGATGADVWIDREADAVVVTITDDGRGFDRTGIGDSGIGLAGMVERARLLGGELAIESAPGAGTRVRLAVPAAACGVPA